MTDHKIYEMPFADVFSHYVAKSSWQSLRAVNSLDYLI